jgi:anti-sigma factor RsiW
MDCNQVQEMVARGECLAPAESAHAAGCVACAAVVASWGQLDALLRDDSAVTVPHGFADRVMAAIVDEPGTVAPLHWFERRWVQVGLVQVGALFSLFNLFRFVLRVLVPSLSLGGSP